MSHKLQDRIQSIKGISGKYKRILLAIARRANNDGTNIYSSKEDLADLAGVSRWTVYRHLPILIEVGILLEASEHTCSKDSCPKGNLHIVGNGHYTVAYNLNVAMLQNATLLIEKLCSKMPKVQCSKMPKSHVAKCDAKQSLEARFAYQEDEASALTSGEQVSELVETFSIPEKIETLNPSDTEAEQDQKQPQWWKSIKPSTMDSGVVCDVDYVLEQLGLCFPRYAHPRDNIVAVHEMRLFQDIVLICDNDQCFPWQVLEYAKTHKMATPALVPRSIQQLWNAIGSSDASTTNGLLQQFKEDDPKTCGICAKELNAKPCDHCHGSTWNKPVQMDGGVYCQECSKLPSYRRNSGKSGYMTQGEGKYL